MMTYALQDGLSPLITASEEGHLCVVNILIEEGAQVNQTKKVVIVGSCVLIGN